MDIERKRKREGEKGREKKKREREIEREGRELRNLSITAIAQITEGQYVPLSNSSVLKYVKERKGEERGGRGKRKGDTERERGREEEKGGEKKREREKEESYEISRIQVF
jgi:hypothetical protein